MLAHFPSFGENPKGSPDFLAYPIPKACMHVLGTGVPRCLGVARSASSPKAAQALGCSLTPGHLHGTGCLSARAMDTGFPTVAWRLYLGLGCGWVRVSAVPRDSWLGCWGVCALLCALRLYPATPGWGVRSGCVWLGSGSGCAPPLPAGVLGCVCARVRAPLAPSASWHGRAVWVCLFELGFRLRPATPGWGVRCGCVCSGSGFGCARPLLARVRAVGVCVWARVPAAPRHSSMGCLGVCVLVRALRLHQATPGTGAWCGCVCLG